MRARTHTRAAQPLQAVPEAGTPAPAGVAAGIARAQGGGERLAPEVRREMESALCADFGAVRVHADGEADRLNRKVDAAAFTLGHDVFFRAGSYKPESPEGRQLLAHELAHVAQQRAAHASTDLDLPGAPHASLAPDRVGAAQGVLQRRKFQGPKFKGGQLVNKQFPGHKFEFVGPARAETGCGTRNRITTAGSKLNHETSAPGKPDGMERYRDGYALPGGFVRDKRADKAATKTHLINHQLDAGNKTQKNPRNIFLGTERSNNPIHYSRVERRVIAAVTDYGSQKNAAYEGAMNHAIQTQNSAGQRVLFWEKKRPSEKAVQHKDLVPQRLISGSAKKGTDNAPAGAKDKQGFTLKVDGYVPRGARYRHLWLRYQVEANYGGQYSDIPAYVRVNVLREEKQGSRKSAAYRKELLSKAADFKADWAENAFPTDFDSSVAYYSATYDPEKGIYRREFEEHNLKADL